jgi:type VI secretion system protein ImpD
VTDTVAPPDRQALRRRIDRAIAVIDAAVSAQLNRILAHPRFAALEAAWRGVAWLAQDVGADRMTRIRLLDARWTEVARDLERAVDVEQSVLFEHLYAQEYDMPGGVPFSLLIGLYAIRHRPSRAAPVDDIAVLRLLSRVAAAAFLPVILDAAPALFGVDDMGELDLRQSLAAGFRQEEYARFQSFQQNADARFIGVVAPRIRLRGPWSGRAVARCGFRYDPDPRGVLWGPGAFAFAHICLRAFNDYRWLAAIRGTVRDQLTGGVIATLPVADYATDAPGKIVRFPLEVHVSEQIDREMADAGFISIRRVKATPYLAIYNMPSLHRPAGAYHTEIARTNERLGAMLNYILCVSRFAHYIKIIGREWIGAFHSADECERRLQRWLNGFTSGGDDLSFDTKARYPLQEARIAVRDVVGKPGSYECKVALKPHFQLDQAISEFHLVTIIQEPRGA